MTIPMNLIEHMSVLYRAEIIDPWWTWYEKEQNAKRALALFVGQYAYDRPGRTHSFSHAAYFAVQESPTLGSEEIWQAFLYELGGTKPYVWLNPLFHPRVRSRKSQE